MKKTYQMPEINVTVLLESDVISTSLVAVNEFDGDVVYW